MRWISSHSGLLLQADALKLRSAAQDESPYTCFCRICDAPVDREALEWEGSRGIEVRVWCEKPYHKGTGAKTEMAMGVERESETETDADLMRHLASFPWFHQGELPVTARRFYDADAGGRPE
jgi:hypothetical protein